MQLRDCGRIRDGVSWFVDEPNPMRPAALTPEGAPIVALALGVHAAFAPAAV